MRLSARPRQWRAALVALALAGCAPGGDDAPPEVAEPTAGTVVDRPLVRVRINPPGELQLGDEDGSGIRLGAHAAWRIDGGPKHDVAVGTLEGFGDSGIYVFAATLQPGDNLLELARCDAVDVCGWTGVSVRFEPRSGAPSHELAGTGLVLLPEGAATEIWPLDDGRALLFAAGAQVELRMLDRSGRPDSSFGERGRVVLPAPGVTARMVRDETGAFLVLLPGNPGMNAIARVRTDGTLDPSWGEDGILRGVGATSAGDAIARDLALDDDGGIVLAGELEGRRALVQRLDASGGERDVGVASAMSGERIRMMRLDDARRLVVASETAVYRVLDDGSLDPSFGDAGVVAVETSRFLRAIALSGETVWLADHVREAGTSGMRLLEIAPSGTRSSLHDVVGLDVEPPMIAVDPSGRVLLAGGRATDESAAWPVRSDLSQEGVAVAIARIDDHALDPTFGDGGVGHASFRLAHSPVPREATTDEPLRLAVGPDGSPWVIARSIEVVGGTITTPRYETLTGLARFVP